MGSTETETTVTVRQGSDGMWRAGYVDDGTMYPLADARETRAESEADAARLIARGL
jgi:hypothetical protein